MNIIWQVSVCIFYNIQNVYYIYYGRKTKIGIQLSVIIIIIPSDQ